MENLLSELVDVNQRNQLLSTPDDSIYSSKKLNVDQESEIENGTLLDYLEIFGYQEDIV
jgi:hypothetical protein